MKVSDHILSLKPYPPGKPLEEARRELGIQEVYKLASNENSFGPSPLALEAMRNNLAEQHRYPDGAGYEIRGALSRHLDVPADWLLFGNGSNDCIDLLIRTFCSEGDAILTSRSAFVAYKICAQASRCETTEVPLTTDLRFDLERLADAWEPRHKIVFIANPNNPTGTYNTSAEVDGLLRRLGNRDDVLIVFDEAYFDYVRATDYPSALALAKAYTNVIALRTFSKIHGLAGLRVGYAVGRPEIMDLANRVRQPFNVNSLAQVAAVAALRDKNHIEMTRKATWAGLDYLYSELGRLGLGFVPSQGNFVLIDVEGDSQPVFDKLLRLGVISRMVKNYGFQTHLRLSVGSPVENEIAIQALRKVFSAGGLLN